MVKSDTVKTDALKVICLQNDNFNKFLKTGAT